MNTSCSQEERILAAASDALGTATNVYDVLTNAEIPGQPQHFPTGQKYCSIPKAMPNIVLKAIAMTANGYLMHSGKTFQDYRQTLAITLEGEVNNHVLTAKLRGYDSALHQALAADNIPEAVYRTLVSTVNENLDTLHRFISLRQRMLKLESTHYYDIYPSVISLDQTYSIEETRDLTLAALHPLGEEYLNKFRDAVSQDWMHVYPSEGKRSGAYVMGAAYDVHPYVLLNHTDDIESVSTFAHEWGHAMHSLLANENQPFTKADYATFTAEIASTANEVLLFDYLREHAKSDQEKLYFIFKELSRLRGTFFRQTQFAEFELAIHEQVESGGALSGDKLNLMYGDILKRYYGHDQGVMIVDDAYTVEWAYVPHFYRNFYVYQYATSISAAYYLTDRILADGEEAQQQYLDILRAGGSQYPYDILLKAGVDMASAEVYEAVIHRMNRLMDQVEAILDQKK
ncbi:MAG: M3 family oligoendopeptidase [Porticoccaceae bacterium]